MPALIRYLISALFAAFILTPLVIADDLSPKKSEKVVRELRATRVNPEALQIDGDLSDSVWRNSKLDFARDFLQTQPDEGEAATESTVVAIVYDDHALYVAFWNYDSKPDKIMQQLVRRDRYTDADQVSVRLDPYHDHQSGYRFSLNASGVMGDTRLFNDTDADRSWDGVWEAVAKLQPWGWSAEFRIPYSCLRFSEKEKHIWGLNLSRYVSRKQESTWWAFSPSSEGGLVSKFGNLTGLQGIMPARHFELLPYTVYKLNTEPEHEGNPNGCDYYGNVGLDFKYAISSNLILDATINPDFGQVELDRPVLNLSSFETFYGEKRPFFLEGANLFETSDFNMFYSRRIGRSPRGWPDDADHFLERPQATTILGAGKLTGKISGNTSIALLNAVTQEETGMYIDTNGFEQEAVIEPLANYSVVRVKRDILNTSYIGVMGTLVSQDTRYPAMTGGLDWRLRTSNGVWETSGQIVASRIDPEEVGFGAEGTFEKAAGKHIRGAIGFETHDPYLDLNNLGFLQRNDRRSSWIWMQYRTQDDWWIIRNTWNNVNVWSSWNYAGDRLGFEGNFNSHIEFMNGWTLGCGFNQNAERWDDRETRGNGLWREPASWSWWSSLTSDQRKAIWININPGSGESSYGTWRACYIGFNYRPRPNIDLDIGSNYVRSFGQIRWIDNLDDPGTGESVPIFADLDQDKITPCFNTSINLTRDLSFQFSGQMLITGLDHQNYCRYIGADKYAPLDGIATEESLDEDNDYNYRAFNSTMVLRWEYRQGSTIYLVWTQARSGVGNYNDVDFGRDFDELFSQVSDGENVYLIKMNYWFNI